MHVSGENGNKSTPNNKKCVIEARVEKNNGLQLPQQPIAQKKPFLKL